MFGSPATNAELMPLPIMIAHDLDRWPRSAGPADPRSRPEARASPVENRAKPARISSVVIAQQHGRSIVKAAAPGDHRQGDQAGLRSLYDDATPYQLGRHLRLGGPEADTGSPDGSSSSTPTAAWPETAAAPFRARTLQVDRSGSYARDGSRRISSPPAGAALRNSALLRHRRAQPTNILVDTFDTAGAMSRRSSSWCASFSPSPQRHHRCARTERRSIERPPPSGTSAGGSAFTWKRRQGGCLRKEARL